MAMTKQEFIELCPAFALGALEAEERGRFLDALATADEGVAGGVASERFSAACTASPKAVIISSSAVSSALRKRPRSSASRTPSAKAGHNSMNSCFVMAIRRGPLKDRAMFSFPYAFAFSPFPWARPIVRQSQIVCTLQNTRLRGPDVGPVRFAPERI